MISVFCPLSKAETSAIISGSKVRFRVHRVTGHIAYYDGDVVSLDGVVSSLVSRLERDSSICGVQVALRDGFTLCEVWNDLED